LSWIKLQSVADRRRNADALLEMARGRKLGARRGRSV
jgi:hypothetical protein